MNELVAKKCTPCEKGSPVATPAQRARFMEMLPEWEIVLVDGVDQLVRTFEFENFAEALEFTNLVAGIAEAEGHHPALLTTWGRVTVRWWTHKIRGLHRNDFVMAAKTDSYY